ncbi:FCD domain-containing protein [Labrenzia sp. CE80]|uniref:FadR/GntR family transcriptional regulator n=1 Tax=Labrenzia sp. CE80 TaxID=1788986 RepID=UPI00129A2541|nr:FCD domain-containing protein [Labrenzia sp. CE80]
MRSWIANSGLGVGAKLPPERDLSGTLGISRTELRKALLLLEVEGSVERRVGSGTFLTRLPEKKNDVSIAGSTAALSECTGPYEAMMARLALEPELARMAALHATPQQLRKLRSLCADMKSSRNWTEYEKLDAAFHDVVASASGNSLLHELFKIVNGVRLVVVWRRLDTSQTVPPSDYHSFDEHDAIVSALERRASGDARKAMQSHLQTTLNAMTSE